jgi:hypothetical protein
MQQQVIAHARDNIARPGDPDQHRPRFHHALDGGLVGFINIHASPSFWLNLAGVIR